MLFKKFLVFVLEAVIGIGIVAASVYAYRNMSPSVRKEGGRMSPIPTVTVSTLKKKVVAAKLEAQGTTCANESVELTASAQEKVIAIDFDDGKHVKKGDVIVRLDSAQEMAILRQAELDLQEAEREMARIKSLYEVSATSQKEYDTQVTIRDRARIEVDKTKAAIADRMVVVPFDGILGKRQVSLGALVSPGTKIATLDDITKIKVDFHVPEKYLAKLSKGQPFTAESIAYPGQKFSGKLTDIDVRLNDVTRSIALRGLLENKKDPNGSWILRPGMLLLLTIELGRAESVMVPEKALLSLGEVQYLFTVNPDGTVSRREVTVGTRSEGFAELLEGASDGEVYVDEGVSKLTDGAKIEIVPSSSGGAANGTETAKKEK